MTPQRDLGLKGQLTLTQKLASKSLGALCFNVFPQL
jgi:hypothetical protein